MADPLKVKAGDTLKIPVKVTYADNATGPPVRIAGDLMPTVMGGQEEFWVSRALVEAAEHIPAPRPAFKRRDLVRQISGRGYQEPYRKGIVLIPEGTRPMMPNFVNVHWPHGETSNEDPRNLEPDEAPE